MTATTAILSMGILSVLAALVFAWLVARIPATRGAHEEHVERIPIVKKACRLLVAKAQGAGQIYRVVPLPGGCAACQQNARQQPPNAETAQSRAGAQAAGFCCILMHVMTYNPVQ